MKELDRPAAARDRLTRSLTPDLVTGPETPPPTVPAGHYLDVAWAQRGKIGAFVVTSLFVTYLISSRLTPIYEATAKIDVDRRIPQGKTGDDSEAFMAAQIKLIGSDVVVRPVAEHYSLQHPKAGVPVHLAALKVTRPLSAYLLHISYRSTDAQRAADVANAIAESYLEQTFRIRLRATGGLSPSMGKKLEQLRSNMERSDLAVAAFERGLSGMDPDERASLLSSRMTRLNGEYATAENERVRKEAAYRAARSGSTLISQGPDLSRLQDQVYQAKQRLADVSSRYGSSSNEYRKAENDLQDLQRRLDDTRGIVSERMESDYRQARSREDRLRRSLRSSEGEYEQLNPRSVEYQQLKSNAETDKKLYSDLEQSLRNAGINVGAPTSSIRINEPAQASDVPVSPRTNLNLLMALLASTVLAICGVILADVLKNTQRDPEPAGKTLAAASGSLRSLRPLSSSRRRGRS